MIVVLRHNECSDEIPGQADGIPLTSWAGYLWTLPDPDRTLPHILSIPRRCCQRWPAGQIMLHIAEAEDGWLRCVVKREQQEWPEYPLAQYPTVAAIRDVLSQVHARTASYLATLDLEDLQRSIPSRWREGATIPLGLIIWHVLEHEIHHRGELSLILGILGREGLDV